MRASSVRKVLGDHRGVVELVMALAFPLVIGMAWLGVEAGQWYLIKRRAQTAADMGALRRRARHCGWQQRNGHGSRQPGSQPERLRPWRRRNHRHRPYPSDIGQSGR